MEEWLFRPEETLDEQQMARLREGMWALLQKRARYLTQGDSASLRVEKAEELLLSIRYTLAFGLRQRGLSEAALADTPLEPLFDEGLAAICAMEEETRQLFDIVYAETPKRLSRSLADTLMGIGLFFHCYDPATAAQETPADVDYQLCLPPDSALRGVLYVREYLLRLLCESRLLTAVEPAAARRALKAYLPEYRLLVANLYEPVMAGTVARVMLGRSPRYPVLSQSMLTRLQALLTGQDALALRDMLVKAAERAACELGLDTPASAYLQEAAKQLTPRILAALPQGALDGVFPVETGLLL